MNHQGHQESQEHRERSRIDLIGRAIVDSGLKVHQALGPGLLETAYEICLLHELEKRGIACRQALLPIVFDGLVLEAGYRLDIVVSEAIIVDIKAVEALGKLHSAQLLTYLKLSGYRLERDSFKSAPALTPTRPPTTVSSNGWPGGGEGRCRLN